MLCTKEEWVKFLSTDAGMHAVIINIDAHDLPSELLDENGWSGSRRIKAQLSYHEMEVLFDELHDGILEGNFIADKYIRPWTITDLYSGLPEDKAWIGWEVETGWRNFDDRVTAVEHIQKNYMHTAYDPEGARNAVEFTFCPRADYSDMTHPLIGVCQTGADPDCHEPEDVVGTHVNVSTPTYRWLTDHYMRRAVITALNHGIRTMSPDMREDLFGRPHPYGGFYTREDGNGAYWVEGKLFNTTYDERQARGYIAVGDSIAKLLETVSAYVEKNKLTTMTLGITNLYDCLTIGAEPVFKTYAYSLCEWYEPGYDDDYEDEFEEEEGGYC